MIMQSSFRYEYTAHYINSGKGEVGMCEWRIWAMRDVEVSREDNTYKRHTMELLSEEGVCNNRKFAELIFIFLCFIVYLIS